MKETYKRTKYDCGTTCPFCHRNFNFSTKLHGTRKDFFDNEGRKRYLYLKTCNQCGTSFQFHWDGSRYVYHILKEGKIKEDTKMNLCVNRRVMMDILERQFIPGLCYHFDAMLGELLEKDLRRCLNDRNTKIIVGKPIYALIINKINKETIRGTRFECSIDTFLGINRYWYKGIPIEESLGGTYNHNVGTITIEVKDHSDGYVPYTVRLDEAVKIKPFFYKSIDRVIFNPPATIVYWHDGSKTVVKDQDYEKDKPFDCEKGLAMAIAKEFVGLSDFYKHMWEDPNHTIQPCISTIYNKDGSVHGITHCDYEEVSCTGCYKEVVCRESQKRHEKHILLKGKQK